MIKIILYCDISRTQALTQTSECYVFLCTIQTVKRYLHKFTLQDSTQNTLLLFAIISNSWKSAANLCNNFTFLTYFCLTIVEFSVEVNSSDRSLWLFTVRDIVNK